MAQDQEGYGGAGFGPQAYVHKQTFSPKYVTPVPAS